MLEWATATKEEWQQAESFTSTRPASEWDAILDSLEQGNVVKLPLAEPAKQRGQRTGIGRRASSRGFKVDMRKLGEYLLVQKRDGVMGEPAHTSKARHPRTSR